MDASSLSPYHELPKLVTAVMMPEDSTISFRRSGKDSNSLLPSLPEKRVGRLDIASTKEFHYSTASGSPFIRASIWYSMNARAIWIRESTFLGSAPHDFAIFEIT